MIEGLRPYPQMKPSGLPGLDEIPVHWEVRRNGRLFGPRREIGYPELPVLEVSLRRGVQVRDFENGSRKQEMTDRSKYQRAVRGDIAYNMMRMWQGAVGIAPVDGLVSPAYVVARPFADIDAAYYAYLFRTAAYMREVDVFSRGIVPDRNRLYWESFKQMPSAYPPLEEQRNIVRFLDWHGAQTAKLIRTKRKLVALLNEQNQAVIHRALTRGIESNTKLKPSGIPWLGDVPEGWNTASVGALSRLIQTGPFGSQLPASAYVIGGVPVVNPSHLVGGAISPEYGVSVVEETARKLDRHRFVAGDIAVARRGELGRCAIVGVGEAGWICGTGTIRLSLRQDKVAPRFVAQLLADPLLRSELQMASVGATMDNLNEGMVARLQIPLPSPEVQRTIIDFAASVMKHSNQAAAGVNREIALLNDFRVRLIADAVTGKLDVRTAASGLSEVSETGPTEDLVEGDDLDQPSDSSDSEEVTA